MCRPARRQGGTYSLFTRNQSASLHQTAEQLPPCWGVSIEARYWLSLHQSRFFSSGARAPSQAFCQRQNRKVNWPQAKRRRPGPRRRPDSLRSRWRLRRLTDAAYPLRVLRPALIFSRAPPKAQLLQDRTALHFFSAEKKWSGPKYGQESKLLPCTQKNIAA